MPKHPTFGFRTTPLCRENDSPFFTLSRYLSDLHMTIIEGRDERWMREEDYLRTISVESDFPPTMLNIDIQTKKSLIDQGFQAAENFIRDWNFPRYVKKKYLDGDKADTSRNNTTGPSSKGD
jgi:NTE family protein